MGLPRYIINYDDSKVFINEALMNSKTELNVNVDMSNVNKAILDTVVLENKTTILTNLNIDLSIIIEEISQKYIDLSKIVQDEIILTSDNSVSTNNIITQISEQEKLIETSLENILNQISPIGIQQVQGFYEYVPPLQKDYEIIFTEDSNILLTSITFSQIGWKLNDSYSLKIGDRFVFNHLYTKEIAEKKRLTHYEQVSKGTPITFILHNNSGNSRQLFIDISYTKIV